MIDVFLVIFGGFVLIAGVCLIIASLGEIYREYKFNHKEQ